MNTITIIQNHKNEIIAFLQSEKNQATEKEISVVNDSIELIKNT